MTNFIIQNPWLAVTAAFGVALAIMSCIRIIRMANADARKLARRLIAIKQYAKKEQERMDITEARRERGKP